MAYSDALATVALVVSLLTAAWTGWRSWRWDRPVVSVSGEQWVKSWDPYHGANTVAVFSLDIVNRGNQATQVTDAYWEIDRGDGMQVRYSAGRGGGNLSAYISGADERDAPSLPFTLERYQRRQWDFEMSTRGWRNTEHILRCRPVVEFVSRKANESAYGDWQPSVIAKLARDAAQTEGPAEP